MSFTEANFENAIIELFRDELGYDYLYGPNVERDYTQPLYMEQLRASLQDINSWLPKAAIDEAINKITTYDVSSLVQKNAIFNDYLQNGVDINYYDGKAMRSTRVRLIDYEQPQYNNFTISNQWTIDEHSVKRADIIVFINGLPLVVMELKSPSREETNVSEAYRQLRNYMQEIPSLFIYNAFCVMSDQATSKAGTITASEDRFMEWKTVDGSREDSRFANFEVLYQGMFDKERLIEIIRNFICYSDETKILAAYHQFYAVRKAITSTIRAIGTNDGEDGDWVREEPEHYGLRNANKQPQGDHKAGVFWHTQGSGKSLSMVFYTKLLQEHISSPTIVVLTDRNDLDGQLYAQFAKCKDFLRQTPIQAESRANLKELLEGRQANGIFFSTMQKFEESEEPLSNRRNIIVIVDEAHRSQYGLMEKVDAKSGKIKIGAARVVRDSLPNATFIGFTGTPISEKDRSTREVFGDYIDVYDMTQSVEDGATKPVFYESRVINLKLNDAALKRIDEEYDIMAEEAEDYSIEKSKHELGRIDSILGADETINSLCDDILSHYEEYRQYEQTGKAMIVAYSRSIEIKIYKKILEMRPDWIHKIKVVMTGGNQDPPEWKDIIGNKSYREQLAKEFKDDESEFKIAIVVDMWLTGFDVPSMATMYIDKPMKGHTLMQAIARVNRVYQDKEAGLIVDYIGMAAELKAALKQYTKRDQDKVPDLGVAYSIAMAKLEVMRDMFYGFNYIDFFGESDVKRLNIIADGVDYALGFEEEESKEYIRE